MPRGGRRTGTPGRSYSNRTDLTTAVAPSQHYGDRAQREAQQQAVPLARRPDLAALTMPPPMVPQGPPLLRETERPGEMVTDGLGGTQMDDFDLLRAVKELYPTAGMSELFEAMGLE